MDTRSTSRASMYRKSTFSKNVICLCKNYTFRFMEDPEAQRGSHEALEELQDLKKGFRKWTSKILFLQVSFGTDSGTKIASKITPDRDQKGNQIHVSIPMNFLLLLPKNQFSYTKTVLFGSQAFSSVWFLGPEWAPKVAPALVKIKFKSLSMFGHFFQICHPVLDSFWEPFWG